MMVLGIIGKILLVLLKILLILLLILLVLLFAALLLPISYEATARADGEKGLDSVDARAAAKYGHGLLTVRIRFNRGELAYSLKLLGRKILKRGGGRFFGEPEEPAEPEETPAPEPVSAPEKPGGREEAEPVRQPEPAAAPERRAREAEQVKVPPRDLPEGREKRTKKQPDREPDPNSWEPEKKSFLDRLAELGNKKEELQEKALKLWDQAQDPANQKTLSRVLKAARKLLRRILPRVVKGKALFGTGDPASTGKILGAFYVCYPLYGDRWDLSLSGDFEQKRIKGKVYLAGGFRLMGLLTPLLGLLADRNIRKLIWKRIKNR